MTDLVCAFASVLALLMIAQMCVHTPETSYGSMVEAVTGMTSIF
jgi:amino acid permease